MSRLQMTFSRLLALGGFTALSGSTFAYYRYNLLGDAAPIADCKPAHFYEERENSPPQVKKHWDDNWDLRKPRKRSDVTLKERPQVPLVDVVNETVTSSPSAPEELKPTATRHVILVRHGQYVSNDDDRFRILSDVGRYICVLFTFVFFVCVCLSVLCPCVRLYLHMSFCISVSLADYVCKYV